MKFASCALLATLALASIASYSCGTTNRVPFGLGPEIYDGGGNGMGLGDPDGGLGNLFGDGGADFAPDGAGGSSTTLPCPAPTTQNDFATPILDTGVAANAPTLFAGADVGTTGPCVYEPEMGALFPNNWIRLRFRFSTSNNENLFEIKLVIPNETSPLVIYTAQTSYTLDATTWSKITAVGVNGPIQVTVRSAVVTNGALAGGPWTGTTGTIAIAPVPAGGSVVYWTTSNGTVLKGFQMGSEAAPQSILTPTQIGTGCIGCHTSTPDGLYIGLTASNDPSTGGPPAFIDVRSVDGGLARPPFVSTDALTLLAREGQHAPAFSGGHWSSGDHIALSMMSSGEDGGIDDIAWTNLEATSQTQGQAWGLITRSGDSNQAASASFSHDGQNIAYTSSSSVNSGTNTPDGLLYVVPYNGGKGGTATALSGASDPTYVQFYPSYSHDDRYVAFNRIPTTTAGGSTYNNPSSEVFVVPAAGGTATRVTANDPPACLGATSPGITNSWAKWSPEVLSACGSTYYFFVFSSDRDPGALGGPQLYVAPIVVDASGKVTSYSAIYPWNQPETEHNHTPAWDVFQLPAPPPPK